MRARARHRRRPGLPFPERPAPSPRVARARPNTAHPAPAGSPGRDGRPLARAELRRCRRHRRCAADRGPLADGHLRVPWLVLPPTGLMLAPADAPIGRGVWSGIYGGPWEGEGRTWGCRTCPGGGSLGGRRGARHEVAGKPCAERNGWALLCAGRRRPDLRFAPGAQRRSAAPTCSARRIVRDGATEVGSRKRVPARRAPPVRSARGVAFAAAGGGGGLLCGD